MTFVTFPQRSTLLPRLAAPLRALGNFLVLLAEARQSSEALERLSRMSDEDLAARGTTRNSEIRRIFGVRAYI